MKTTYVIQYPAQTYLMQNRWVGTLDKEKALRFIDREHAQNFIDKSKAKFSFLEDCKVVEIALPLAKNPKHETNE